MKRTAFVSKTPMHSRAEVKPRASKEAKEDAPRKPRAKCKQCKTALPAGQWMLHDECIGAWWEAKREMLRAKVERVKKAEVRAADRMQRATTRQRKEAVKTRAKWEAECRAIVQKIARIRDRHDGCISCNLPATWDGQWHGSHFRSHGAASAVQLHLWNIHKSCSACNLHKSGNLEGYRPRLIAKIGQAKVDWLLAQNGLFKPPMDYYARFKKVMGKRLRRMERAAQREAA